MNVCDAVRAGLFLAAGVFTADASFSHPIGLAIQPSGIETLADGSTRLTFDLVGCKGYNGEPCKIYEFSCTRSPERQVVFQGEFEGIGYVSMAAYVHFSFGSVRIGQRGANASFQLLSVERMGDFGLGSWRLRWDLQRDDEKKFFALLAGDEPIPLYSPPMTLPAHDHTIDVLRTSASGENLVAEFVGRCSGALGGDERPAEGDRP